MSKLLKSSILVTSALCLAAPAAVRAADTVVATGQAEIEQVVVTAQRREERLQDVPISITVFNQRQLQNHNIVNAADLANYTPSLQSNNEFGSQNSSFAIRGFVQDIGTAPSVGVFFDDVVAPRGLTQGIQGGDGAGPGDFFDLQNVQILKGPQGTLFGRNTTGGDILLVPQKPTDEFGGYVQGSFGNYNLRGGQGVINIPVNDQIRLRFGIDHESRDGYLHNTSGIGPSDFDDVNYTALRASADIDITPDLEDYIVASYSDSDTHGDFQKLVACNPNPNPAPSSGIAPFLPAACEQLGLPASVVNPHIIPLSYAPPQGNGFYDAAQGIADPYSRLSIWRVINSTTWQASDNLTVKNIASYAELNDQIQDPTFGSDFHTLNPAHPAYLGYPFQFASVTDFTGGSFANQGTYTEELQLLGNYWGDRLTWQTGTYLEGSVPIAAVGAQSPVSLYCSNSAAFKCNDVVAGNIAAYEGIPERDFPTYIGDINYNPGTTNTNDYAIYGQGTYKLTDYLKLTGGFRYSWDRMSNTGRRIYYDFDFPQQSVSPYAPQPPMIVNSNCANPSAPNAGVTGSGAKAGFGTTPVPPGDCITSVTERSNAPTWLLDLDYTPTEDILVYAKWARGYRQGVVDPNVPSPYNVTGREKVDDYELGIKTSFNFGGISGTLDADGFYDNFRNQQLLQSFEALCNTDLTVTCVTPTSATFNLGKSQIDGLELDATLVPYQGVALQIGYTYLDTGVLSARKLPAVVGPFSVQPTAQAGDGLPLSPKNKLSLTAAYTLPLDDSIGKITLSTTFTYTDTMLTNYIDLQIPGYAYLGRTPVTKLLDFNLNWEQVMGHPVDLSIFATNVTDDRYYTFTGGLLGATDFETAAIGAPTFYGVRVKIHFGED